jgi:hypothetical protein
MQWNKLYHTGMQVTLVTNHQLSITGVYTVNVCVMVITIKFYKKWVKQCAI